MVDRMHAVCARTVTAGRLNRACDLVNIFDRAVSDCAIDAIV